MENSQLGGGDEGPIPSQPFYSFCNSGVHYVLKNYIGTFLEELAKLFLKYK